MHQLLFKTVLSTNLIVLFCAFFLEMFTTQNGLMAVIGTVKPAV